MMEQLNQALNARTAEARRAALNANLPALRPFNMHCHSCYSYNGYGYAPTYIAALGAASSWRAAGLVDFDVLDGVDEFLAAAKTLRLPAVAGMETRVFVPELKEAEINSPGEPGIAYHLGMNFRSSTVPRAWQSFAAELRSKANGRTAGLVERVNAALPEIALDFKAVAAAYTPAGNVTERHVCAAYRAAAEAKFKGAELEQYWKEKIGEWVADPVKLEGKIRSKLMKKGGVGYVAPKPENFPTLEEMNQFILGCGAVPTVAWLNGLSAGEADPAALLEMHRRAGAGAVTIIPDRNWRNADPEKAAKLCDALDKFLAVCAEMKLPVLAGTEMNAPGQLLADDFTVPALRKHYAQFAAGADAFTNL